MVCFLLDSGACVCSLDMHKNTPLHVAARFKKYEVARLLLDRGASANAVNQYKQTPLHLLARVTRAGDSKFARLLIRSKISVNAKNRWG